MSLQDNLGFTWDRDSIPNSFPIHSIERVCFRMQRLLPEFVWDAGVLEGNPFTFVEVKTLLDGVTVGGRKISDQEQILNLADSSEYLLEMIRGGSFTVNKSVFCALHHIVARNEALEWGHFRGEGKEVQYTPEVSLGESGRYLPPKTEVGSLNLQTIFQRGIDCILEEIEQPFEQAVVFFMFGALQQFFFDGNKRTSRLMMNGILMSHGIDAVSIPASAAEQFNEKMVRFYLSKDATEMILFISSLWEKE